MGDVATTKLFENDRVIVWEFLLEPGDSSGVHTHQYDYFFHVLEGSTIRATDKDGNMLAEFNMAGAANATTWVEVRDGMMFSGDASLPATHSAINVGPTRHREILVEIK